MKKILFACGENAGRSQMAEAFFNHYIQQKNLDWLAESAGTYPADRINPLVQQVMEEKSINLAKANPKLFDPQKAADYEKLVSFGCIVKSYFSKEIQNRIDEWHIDDPRDKNLVEVRGIRDEIDEKVRDLIKELGNNNG